MTFKQLCVEIEDLPIDKYQDVADFIQKLKNKNTEKSDNSSKGLEDWSITKENWHEIELA